MASAVDVDIPLDRDMFMRMLGREPATSSEPLIGLQEARAGRFGEKVLGRESMCMVTPNVFGTIAARNIGDPLPDPAAAGSPVAR